MVVEEFNPSRPVSVMHIHSVDDPRALYEGGEGPPFPFTSITVVHPNLEGQLSRWVQHNGCPELPAESPTLYGAPGTADEGHSATKILYGPCEGGTEVILWKLTGAGHVWPGGLEDYLEIFIGPSTGIIDANEEIWRFFSHHSLDHSD
jgi:polyhydroxybutyrate depolymerase